MDKHRIRNHLLQYFENQSQMTTPVPLNCVIVDDEPLALSLLGDYVIRTAGLTLSASFSKPLEALKYLSSNETDLLFLDVQMPDLTGIQLLKILRPQSAIILTTAYPEFALEGFENDVWDYLLKPISFDRFLVSVNKIKLRLAAGQVAALQITTRNYFFVKSENKVIKLHYDEILYLEGMRDYVAIHTSDKRILTLQSLGSFEQELPVTHFIRIHKSYIINLEKVRIIEKGYIGIGKVRLPVGGVYEERVKKVIFNG